MSRLGQLFEKLLVLNIRVILPTVKSFDEQEIRTFFRDKSLNGIDHWFIYKNRHCCIQDKIKTHITQSEMSQFIHCVERMKQKILTTDPTFVTDTNFKTFLVTKCKPTANSITMLNERNINIIQNTIYPSLIDEATTSIINFLTQPTAQIIHIITLDSINIIDAHVYEMLLLFEKSLNAEEKRIYDKCLNMSTKIFYRDAFIALITN